MDRVLAGTRVIEVAQYVFVPTAAGVLAEWGADVVKVEPLDGGDAYRGLRASGPLAIGGDWNYAVQHANRGKRSIGIDLREAEGQALLRELVAGADVFMTNLLPATRRKLRIEYEDVKAHNPGIVYARGSALGQRGPECEKGGFDYATFWARGGAGVGATDAGAARPAPMPSPAFGDTMGATVLAGGIGAALYARERTGEGRCVDVSLLGLGAWAMGAGIAASLAHQRPLEPLPRIPPTNPLAGVYATADGRWISLTLLQGHPFWAPLCRALGRPELAEDPRFATREAFAENGAACAALLDEIFGGEPLDVWRERLADFEGVWSAFQDSLEVADDPQTRANDAVVEVDGASGGRLVRNPVEFDGTPCDTTPAPEAGQHTEEILLELGLDWDRIGALKRAGVIT